MSVAAARRAGANTHATKSGGHDHAHHGRAHGQAGALVDFLSGRIGLGSHVLVALNHALPPSQVARVVAAFRAGAPLARELDTKGKSPAQIIADPKFGWTSPSEHKKDAAPSDHKPHDDRAHEDKLHVLLSRLAETIRDELADESRQSPKVMIQAIAVAQHNNAVGELCSLLETMPDARYGTCFDGFLSVVHANGGDGLAGAVGGMVARAGISTAPDPAIAKMTTTERYWRATKLGARDVPHEVVEQALAMIPIILGVFVAAQFTPAGPVLDVVGVAFDGQMILQLVDELMSFRNIAHAARSDRELAVAGEHFARAIATIGIIGIGKLARYFAKRAAKAIETRKAAKAQRAADTTSTTEDGDARESSEARIASAKDADQSTPPLADRAEALDDKATRSSESSRTDAHEPAEATQQGAKSTAPASPEGAHELSIDRAQHAKSKTYENSNGRINRRIAGHAESVGSESPKGWSCTDESHADKAGTNFVTTNAVGPGGKKAMFQRGHNATTKTLVLKQAFMQPEAPSRVQHAGVMMQSRGTPTQSFFTLRQMKQLGVTIDNVQHVKMDNVQNVRSVLELERARRANIDLATVLPTIDSVRYASTPLTQAGFTIVPDSIRITGGWEDRIGDYTDHQEDHGWADPDANIDLLRGMGFTKEDIVPIGFDITFDVVPTTRPK